MNEDVASLDRLHDIVTSSPVPWWPLAPGWYLLCALVLGALLAIGLHAWFHWKRNGYRREAMKELKNVDDAAAIASLLRRTAIAESGRDKIAKLQGDAWTDWLSTHGPEPLPRNLRQQLIEGVYDSKAPTELASLRAWAMRWVSLHRKPLG